jgi:hypothetical protein
MAHRSSSQGSNKPDGRETWPPRSSGLISIGVFFGGCVEDRVYILPTSRSLQELKDRIGQAMGSVGTQTTYAKHETSSEAIWVWSGLPMKPN